LVGHGLVVLFALLAALFLAIGIVVRQRATMDVPEEQGVSAVMVLTLLRRPLWWGGTAAAIAGFVFQALALAYGSLLLVQPILVSALLFALPIAAWEVTIGVYMIVKGFRPSPVTDAIDREASALHELAA